jgi:rhamnulokinase
MFACLAVDLGATSGRVSYGTLRRDVLAMVEVSRFPNRPTSVEGVLYWDSSDLFEHSLRGLSRALTEIAAAGFQPRSIGVDSWGVDYGLVGPNSSASVRTRHYRSAPDETVHRLRASISASDAYRLTGISSMPINSVYQLADSVRRGEVSPGSTALLIPDLWVYWLTGMTGAERSIASTTELLDAASGDWSAEMVELAGIPRSVLPPVCDTGTVAGALLPDRRAELRYEHPLSIVRVAEHDTASAVLAMPVEKPFAFISCGSWALVGQELKAPVLSEDARCAGFTNEQGAYGTTLFMRNLAGLWLLEEFLREWNHRLPSPLTVADVLGEAGNAEPFRSFIDVGDPDFLRPGNLTDRLVRHCEDAGQPAPSTPGEVTRCLIESLALAYRLTIQQSERLTGVHADVVHVIGGGARNQLLCQLTADACERPVVAGPAEATSSGNVLVQLISAGVIENVEHARAVMSASASLQRYLPNPARQVDWRSASERLVGF